MSSASTVYTISYILVLSESITKKIARVRKTRKGEQTFLMNETLPVI